MNTLSLLVVEDNPADVALAFERIDKLQEMLPICPCCKKIHAEDDNWYQPDEYFKGPIYKMAGQSVCPDCLHELHGSKNFS